MDIAPQFIKFAFRCTGEFIQGGSGLWNGQGDEGFAGQAVDRAMQVRRVAVSFESVENVIEKGRISSTDLDISGCSESGV